MTIDPYGHRSSLSEPFGPEDLQGALGMVDHILALDRRRRRWRCLRQLWLKV